MNTEDLAVDENQEAKKYDKLIKWWSHKYHIYGMDREDLEGQLWLVWSRCYKRFDPTREIKFNTFLTVAVRREIGKLLSKSAMVPQYVMSIEENQMDFTDGHNFNDMDFLMSIPQRFHTEINNFLAGRKKLCKKTREELKGIVTELR